MTYICVIGEFKVAYISDRKQTPIVQNEKSRRVKFWHDYAASTWFLLLFSVYIIIRIDMHIHIGISVRCLHDDCLNIEFLF